jgi:hypothetical protein
MGDNMICSDNMYLSSFDMALRMALSTCCSHSSTGPSMGTLSTKGADSPSGEFISSACLIGGGVKRC